MGGVRHDWIGFDERVLWWLGQYFDWITFVRLDTVIAVLVNFEHGVEGGSCVLILSKLGLDLLFYALDELRGAAVLFFKALALLKEHTRVLLAEGIEVVTDHAFHGVLRLDVTAILHLAALFLTSRTPLLGRCTGVPQAMRGWVDHLDPGAAPDGLTGDHASVSALSLQTVECQACHDIQWKHHH